MKKSVIAAALGVFVLAGASAQTAQQAPFTVSVNFSSNCAVKTSGNTTMAFTYTAFQAADATNSKTIDFQCSKGVTPASFEFVKQSAGTATISAAGATPTAEGVLAGLLYHLDSSYAAGTAGQAAQAGTGGTGGTDSTGDVYTVTINGKIPGGQGGDQSDANLSHTYYVQVNY